MPSSVSSRRPPSLLALPSYLAGSVARLGNAGLVEVLAQRGMRLPQFAVLTALADFGDLAPHELATRLVTDRSHISAFVEELVKRGLVRRDPHPTDRRRLIVTLTKEGATMTSELSAAAADAGRSLLSALTDDEQDALRRLLLKVIVAAEAEPAATAASFELENTSP